MENLSGPVLKKILVAVDNTAPSRHAVDMAVYLAHCCQAELTLCTVIDLNQHISSWEQVSNGGYIPVEIKNEAAALLQDMCHRMPQDITIHTRSAPPKCSKKLPNFIMAIFNLCSPRYNLQSEKISAAF